MVIYQVQDAGRSDNIETENSSFGSVYVFKFWEQSYQIKILSDRN